MLHETFGKLGITQAPTDQEGGIFWQYKQRAEAVAGGVRSIARKVFGEQKKEMAIRMHYLTYHARASLNGFSEKLFDTFLFTRNQIIFGSIQETAQTLEDQGINYEQNDTGRIVVKGNDKRGTALFNLLQEINLEQYFKSVGLLDMTLGSSPNTPKLEYIFPPSQPAKLITKNDLTSLLFQQGSAKKMQSLPPDSYEPHDPVELLPNAIPQHNMLVYKSEINRPNLSEDPRPYVIARAFMARMFDSLEGDITYNETKGHVLASQANSLDGVQLYKLGGDAYDAEDFTKRELSGIDPETCKNGLLVDPDNIADPRVQAAQRLIKELFKLPENLPLIPSRSDVGKILVPGVTIEMSQKDDTWDIFRVINNKNPGITMEIHFRRGEDKAESIFIIHNKF